ncbi:NAD(P)/FAD-dependent oxidoreductase [Ectobacillus antri]|jgi:NADH dehydrogenase|uniref:NAD(P)/FAD-dependent oxidoreductase n=1 Tax=Ectobacillus antri TaxID=2486280 RepID=A0ABT6H9M3_9BACI|nr:NAD(P)/FAD-dependent oxidoreductase [Ectobacillus antri]MDG4658252.1 NAD(P)/FAD-dependent oxidoreductase [Ectobacillus antri]MDG5755367.1 NAD(P)/FAD-dependent oxidoreductase [Ectobacillus antri]
MKHLVILGGGYGGMRILQRLLPNLPDDTQVTLIDKVPYHCFKTEYYALVAGTISETDIRIPFPEHPRLTVKYGTIVNIDIDARLVELQHGETVSYDDLIIGLGCEDKYHNVPGAKEYTCSVQSIEKSRQTYQQLNGLAPHATVGIVGAGLSGVEVASELRESRPDLNILLFDRGERILSMFPKKLSLYVEDWFVKHNVTIIRNSNITKVEPHLLHNHEEAIPCDAIVWTAGIQASLVVQQLPVEKDNSGRVVLTKYHNIPNYENVYVLGDCASLPHAPSAQLAEGQAEQIVTILQKRWKQEELPETMPVIKLKGVLGSLGKKHGFGLLANQALMGRVPRLLKSGILWMYKHHNG